MLCVNTGSHTREKKNMMLSPLCVSLILKCWMFQVDSIWKSTQYFCAEKLIRSAFLLSIHQNIHLNQFWIWCGYRIQSHLMAIHSQKKKMSFKTNFKSLHLLKSIQFVFLFPFVEIFYATNDIESELKPCYDHDFSFASPFIRKRTDIHDNFSKSTQHIAPEFKKHIKKIIYFYLWLLNLLRSTASIICF